MNPTTMAERSMLPTCGSNPFGGEQDALKVARPVRWGDGADQPEQSGHWRRRPHPIQNSGGRSTWRAGHNCRNHEKKTYQHLHWSRPGGEKTPPALF